MRKCTVHLKSTAPYSQSRMHRIPKEEKETADAHEERTWREKCTVDSEGYICIPAMAFKQGLSRAAKMLSMQIPGRGKATYSKHFEAGIIIYKNVRLPVKKAEVERIAVNCNGNGIRGPGTRVLRFFPQVPSWEADVEVAILDDTITPAVFQKHFEEAGLLVGVGQNRPENGGSSGRFDCVDFKWEVIG